MTARTPSTNVSKYVWHPLRGLVCSAVLALSYWVGPIHGLAQPADVSGEGRFLTATRQLTFDGLRTGEGYFSKDGKRMVFQSERESSNPFYQIYWMDRETGDVERVSPGHGKTTCAWIHPTGGRVLFASTQFDPQARDKQQEEISFRASGQQRRYSWDYDPEYDLVEWNHQSGEYKQLTHEKGYDAEGSYSPDGEWIVFASNRRAYDKSLSNEEEQLFLRDPATAIDIYLMRRDGTDVKRLTTEIGYDGGPFFSPDGERIVWRKFSQNGATAEIYTMRRDGTDVKRLTTLSATTWAPYYHPSGDYLIFNSNPEGFANFELYIIDVAGKHEPVRVTYTDGFDGLPVFTPDGKSLVWTSNRTANKRSQLFIAQWNDAAARAAIGLISTSDRVAANDNNRAANASADVDALAARDNVRSSAADFLAADIGRHVDFLCRPELGGRLTGTEGERRATAYVASSMESLGLKPGGENGQWFQSFPFTAGARLGDQNRLRSADSNYELDKQWRPLFFSKQGEIAEADVVFAGYGIVAPADEKEAEYDSYVHLDVAGKWVVVLRQLPMDISPERRQHLGRFSSLRFKATAARDRGAVGMIVVSGPTSGVRQQLVPLNLDGALAGSSIAAISVTDDVVANWMKQADKSLESVQKELDKGEMMMGFPLTGTRLSATIEVQSIKNNGRNVLGWLRAGDTPSPSAIVIGAHIDHLGTGPNTSSLAKEDERSGIHRGADDNASGVAAMLEIAQYLAEQKQAGRLKLNHDILFAAWSGEELGLLGSSYFADHYLASDPHNPAVAAGKLYPAVIANLNLDMVGRLRDKLVLQGIGSSSLWSREIEQRNAIVGLPLTLQNDSYLPTDASTFYTRGVPVLSAFTGNHSEYHTPRDTPDLLNYEGTAQIAKLMGLIARSLAASATPPDYIAQTAPENRGQKAMLTAYLGTIPDYAKEDVKGVYLAGVQGNSPAAKAGVTSGDIVIQLAGKKVENLYDYTFAIEALRVGQETEIVVLRGGNETTLKVTPASRQ